MNAARDVVRAALVRAGLTHGLVAVLEADHAFFNNTGPR
jgi:carboxymethylenebutenolidase